MIGGMLNETEAKTNLLSNWAKIHDWWQISFILWGRTAIKQFWEFGNFKDAIYTNVDGEMDFFAHITRRC